MDKGISDEEAEDLKEAWKKSMGLIADERKPRFANFLQRLNNSCNLI